MAGPRAVSARACSHSSLDCSFGMSGKKSRSMIASSASAHSSSSSTSGFRRDAWAAGARGAGGAMSRCCALPAEPWAEAVRLPMVPRAGRPGTASLG